MESHGECRREYILHQGRRRLETAPDSSLSAARLSPTLVAMASMPKKRCGECPRDYIGRAPSKGEVGGSIPPAHREMGEAHVTRRLSPQLCLRAETESKG
jgi:hypothetical protein